MHKRKQENPFRSSHVQTKYSTSSRSDAATRVVGQKLNHRSGECTSWNHQEAASRHSRLLHKKRFSSRCRVFIIFTSNTALNFYFPGDKLISYLRWITEEGFGHMMSKTKVT
ncbi:hypothetical protein RRG08_031369 [Elysia crispata]|uniref:Uncharacterized protein n=1 Tax=Elysia crispata TaxID=231223 RepID=A0AAE0YI65_9GAST|nr:hypothetical protein RRG08_031369 [Elysia crispata]